MNFWDSSAIIPLCFDGDAFTERMRTIADHDDGMVTWWGTQVECCSAFARLRRNGVITSEEEQQSRNRLTQLSMAWSEVEPSEKLRQLSRQLLLRQDIRAADTFQLAGAIIWAEGDFEGRGFVTLDRKLRSAAQSEGFNIIPCQHDYDEMTGGA